MSAALGIRNVTASSVIAGTFRSTDTITRSQLSKASKMAAQALKLKPALRLVLNELVGVYGENTVDDRLIVWPSNSYLENRTGLCERTIRYCISKLIELRLLAPKDSANGKRFAIYNKKGSVVDAFGFDLSPITTRLSEFENIVESQNIETMRIKRAWDEITINRNFVRSCLDVLDIDEEFEALCERTPRRSKSLPDSSIAQEWEDSRLRCEELLKSSAYEGNSCRHIKTNKEADSSTCRALEEKNGGDYPTINEVVSACEVIEEYAGPVGDLSDLIAKAAYLRATVGAHESAWAEAVGQIGAVNTAIILFIVLQLHSDDEKTGSNTIKNPGGYFRAMCRMYHDGRINLKVELARVRNRR